jgi:hypothetical protein
MPVNFRSLSAACYSQGITAWFYSTPDSRRDLEGHTYWQDASTVVKPGDWLFVTHAGASAGNSIYAFYLDPSDVNAGPLIRARRMISTFGED